MTQLRRRIIGPAIAVAVLGASLLAAGCGTSAPGLAHTLSAVTSTTTIDPQVGETFGPAPSGATPALTPQQAWASGTQADASDEASDSSSAIPANVTPQLGVLTLPLGPAGPDGAEIYSAQDELVYGYSWPSCPASTNPNMQTLPANPCIEWEFIDANTGQEIDDTWQQ